LKIAAIVPVKTFSKAKTRLKLSASNKNELCGLMLEEVLRTISDSTIIDKIIVVTKDENALSISKKFNAISILDKNETSVNNAVSLADDYVLKQGFDTSVVFPQDIPFMISEDIDKLLKFQNSSKHVGVVPSRKFDGTNALVRMPVNLMKTHYDEDSYKLHLDVGKSITPNSSLILLRRIMLDIDDQKDIEFMKILNEKPQLCHELVNICKSSFL
jgi:2-phospho-L-lactate/phosphoenolpyruvate guanylyltransferase